MSIRLSLKSASDKQRAGGQDLPAAELLQRDSGGDTDGDLVASVGAVLEPAPEMSVNTRKGIVVNYAPAENAG